MLGLSPGGLPVPLGGQVGAGLVPAAGAAGGKWGIFCPPTSGVHLSRISPPGASPTSFLCSSTSILTPFLKSVQEPISVGWHGAFLGSMQWAFQTPVCLVCQPGNLSVSCGIWPLTFPTTKYDILTSCSVKILLQVSIPIMNRTSSPPPFPDSPMPVGCIWWENSCRHNRHLNVCDLVVPGSSYLTLTQSYFVSYYSTEVKC